MYNCICTVIAAVLLVIQWCGIESLAAALPGSQKDQLTSASSWLYGWQKRATYQLALTLDHSACSSFVFCFHWKFCGLSCSQRCDYVDVTVEEISGSDIYAIYLFWVFVWFFVFLLCKTMKIDIWTEMTTTLNWRSEYWRGDINSRSENSPESSK